MERVRIGIVGVGQIGKSHIATYSKIPGAQLVAAADVNEAELKKVAAENGIPHTYANFRDLLARDDVHAVDVCLHNNLHMPVTCAALKAGKHVYCEKPMAGSYHDALTMRDTAKACDRHLSIQLSTLFSKETRFARQFIAEGRLGRIYHARSTGYRRRGRPFVDGYGTAMFVKKEMAAGGALYDMGVYHIAQILHLLDCPRVERVSGKAYQELDMDAGRRASSGYNVEELGLGFVKFEGGVTLDVMEAWAVHMNAFEGSCVMGSQGGIRLAPFSLHTAMGDVEADVAFNLDGADWRRHQLRENEDAWDSPQHHWIAALQGRTTLLPTAEVALKTMLISEGIYLSDRLGREVSRDEIVAASRPAA